MDAEAILAEYDRSLPELQRLAAAWEANLRKELRDIDGVRSLTARIKSRGSLANKLRRPDKYYASLPDVTDVIGVRVITMLAADVPQVIDVLERSFTVDGENSWDMSWMLGTQEFGYKSVHYVVAVRPMSRETSVSEIRCEVQVRSLLQDAWAQIAHGFSYKSLLSIPEAAHRRMSLAAGLLEVADRELGELRTAVDGYRHSVAALRDEANGNGVSRESIVRVLTGDEDVVAIDRAIAADEESALLAAPPDYIDAYVRMVTRAGFRDTAEAVRRLVANVDAVRTFAHAIVRRGKRPRILYRGVCLFYLCYFESSRDVPTL